MIFIDTNVLVALANPRDSLNARAVADLERLAGRAMVLTQAVLTESLALVTNRPGRSRMRKVIEAIHAGPCALEADREFRDEAFDWLEKYAEHDPDWADAVLAVLAGRFSKSKVWTYDREFAGLWRTPAGSAIPLAASLLGR